MTTRGLPATESVQRALSALAAGAMVVVTDDPERENEGDLVMAAAAVSDAEMAFMVRHGTGIICVPMTELRADALRLPPMVAANNDRHHTAFTISADLIGTGSGVSASARAATVRAMADPGLRPEDLLRPGHVFPLRARDGGVLVRGGHTEAAVDLLTLAGLDGVGVITEIVNDDGSMCRGRSLSCFAVKHDLPVVAIADLIRYRRATERLVEPVAAASMPTEFGQFRAVAYRSKLDGVEHLAMVMGDVVAAGRSEQGALVRMHSECLTGDILASLRCDCGFQLEQAFRAIAEHGCGAIVYLRGHEGRGIGLGHKIRAYALQEDGMDTVEANTAQGLAVDSRSYGIGAQILKDLGVQNLRLITNNPAKYSGLDGYGIRVVGRVGLPTSPNPHNVRYLRTKRDRLGHLIDLSSSDAVTDNATPATQHDQVDRACEAG